MRNFSQLPAAALFLTSSKERLFQGPPMVITRRNALIATVAFLLAIALLGCGGTAVSPPGAGSTGGSSNNPPPPPPANTINSVQHIIFMLQENRSFDSYFGQLGAYRAANGYGAAT